MRITPRRERETASAAPISIIITCFNQARFLPDVLATLWGQSLADWAAVIVDDGSTDDSARTAEGLIAGDDRLTLVRKPQGGVSSARNAGLRALNPFSPAVMFADADDGLLPDALETLTGLLDADPRAVCAVGRPVPAGPYLAPDPDAWHFEPARAGLLDFPALDRYGVLYPPSVALVRRWAAEAAGPFDQGMIWEDRDWFMRLALLGPFILTDRPVTLYRRHARNATSDAALMDRGARDMDARMRAYRLAWEHRAAWGHQRDTLGGTQ